MQENILIQMLGSTDGAVLENVADGVFDGPLNPQWTVEFLLDPRHHMVVAVAGQEVVGMVSAVHYIHPDKPPELWINEVGVAPPFQQQGIATRLIDCLLQYASELGCREAWVLTEDNNIGAKKLYAKSRGKQPDEAVVYYTFRV